MKRTVGLLVLFSALLALASCGEANESPVAAKVWDQYLGEYDAAKKPVSIAEFPNVAFTYGEEDATILANGEKIASGCLSFYTCDFTGDGYPELCFGCSLGSGFINEYLTILDYKNDETLLSLGERFKNDCYFYLEGETLRVRETEPMQRDTVIRTGRFAYAKPAVKVVWDE